MTDLFCVICKDVFVNPFFCTDGFTYCKNCIGLWEQVSGNQWLSPRSNRVIYDKALLVRNEQMVIEVRKYNLQIYNDLIKCDQIASKIQALSMYCDNSPMYSRAEGISTLRTIGANSPNSFNNLNARAHIILDCCYNTDRLKMFLLGGHLNSLLSSDKSDSSIPFVSLRVLIRLSEVLTDIIDSDVLASAAQNLIDHLFYRESTIDVIQIMRHSILDGVYFRSVDGTESTYVEFVSFNETGVESTMHVPTDSFHGLNEDFRETCIITENGARKYYASQQGSNISSGVSRWAARKATETVFPDNDDGCASSDFNLERLVIMEKYPKTLPRMFLHRAKHTESLTQPKLRRAIDSLTEAISFRKQKKRKIKSNV